MEFSGAKLVCLIGGRLLTLLRDDRPDIVFPDYWDMPGGGREDGESPESCVLRETREELSLLLGPDDLLWRTAYPSPTRPGTRTFWFAARLPHTRAHGIRLGDEGQGWDLMAPEVWLAHPKAIPHFRTRVRDGLAALDVLS